MSKNKGKAKKNEKPAPVVEETTEEETQTEEETPGNPPGEDDKPDEEKAEESTESEEEEKPKEKLPVVPLAVFCKLSGKKPDQIAGFRRHALIEKLKPMTIPQWKEKLVEFQNKPMR